MAKKRPPGLPEFHDVQPQLEAEVRRSLAPTAPPGTPAMPSFSQADLDVVMRVLPVLWDSFRRVLEAAYGTS